MKGRRPFTVAEMKQLISSCDDLWAKYPVIAARNRAMFVVFAATGIRATELRTLELRDVSENDIILDYLNVRKQNMKGGKGKRKIHGRVIPMSPTVRQELSEWLSVRKAQKPTDILFPSMARRAAGNEQFSTKPMSSYVVWRIVKQACRYCGIVGNVASHSFRKSYAKAMYDSLDGHLLEVQRAMGHTAISSTLAYLSFNDEAVNRAIAEYNPFE